MKKGTYKIINILIVEDNEDHLYFIKKALSIKSYNFLEITSGIEAYNYLLNPTVIPDIVLLGNKLPGMKGLEILTKLKEKKKVYNIIFQTIDNTIDLVVAAMNAGATDFILKTPDLKYILPQKINKILKDQSAEQDKLELEAHFKSIVESGDDDIWSLDLQYKITAFNQSFKKNIFGLTNKKIKIGDSIFKIFPKNNIAFWKPKYDKVLKGEKLSFEFSNVNDKLSRHYDFRLSPILIKGMVTGISAIGRDITQRKKKRTRIV